MKCDAIGLVGRCDANKASDEPQVDEIGAAAEPTRSLDACILPTIGNAPELGPISVNQWELSAGCDVVPSNKN